MMIPLIIMTIEDSVRVELSRARRKARQLLREPDGDGED